MEMQRIAPNYRDKERDRERERERERERVRYSEIYTLTEGKIHGERGRATSKAMGREREIGEKERERHRERG